ncbi:Glucoamylase (glucan-1,4-alpha-glucosidase), GH15 family [Nakamurella panacisegetis]|uniref:Glucoamylase (Glucan-1,4-alpha-glucosidase), GH15 family n=1 Tax=Nakamurella panacisegetis TaxID=1090615 RepID=A0A1H0IZ99_9ACTN|nr:glycoside hydrolase family 15 protein [Nakamurella panacisegetis]SDO36838.1 Glucoamylase (glucan-1,4-alpha-glucosidase), GH15 family [Nakamurella panacisegetis]
MTTDRDRFPPQVLREYALLADGERGALVGPRGDIVWMCAPRWDSGAVFSALLGGRSGYSVTPRGRFVWGGFYEEGTLIWRSRWVTETGIVECREALAFPGDPHRAVILRRIIAVDADATVTVTLDPRADFDQHHLLELRRQDGRWTATSGGLHLRWTVGSCCRPDPDVQQGLVGEITVPAGTHHDLVLEISDQTLPVDPDRADILWPATEAAWAQAVPALDRTLDARDSRRAYAVMRGLTSASGGMVAAATTSLPERAEAGRNYDYRYVWIRDQCYAGQAVAAAGPHRLLDDAVRFVSERLLDHGDQLRPAYTVTGDSVPDQVELQLPGYPGGHNKTGNWVNRQFQLDAFGESLLLFAAAAAHQKLDSDHRRAAGVAALAIARRWREPDAGIWEIDNQAWTHSRLICAAGLRAYAAHEPADTAAGWLTLADQIIADTGRHATHPTGRWQRSATDPNLDAALLLPPLRGAIAVDDPRTVATLDAYLSELTVDGYAYRFRHDGRPLAQAEGSFTLCGFITAQALHQQGQSVVAARWYERTRGAQGPPELYSEEFDAGEHQLRGNLPQAFVHALHLQTAASLAADVG